MFVHKIGDKMVLIRVKNISSNEDIFINPKDVSSLIQDKDNIILILNNGDYVKVSKNERILKWMK